MLRNCLKVFSQQHAASRSASSASALVKRRRFYKEVTVVDETVDDQRWYKVALDGRILKTQGGGTLKLIQFESEPLALAVAEEWASQGENLEIHLMRLTGLSFTAHDNPLHTTKESITAKILEYLDGDTVLYWNTEMSTLHDAQEKVWRPIVEHMNREMNIELVPCETMIGTPVKTADREKVGRWLMGHGHWALHGLQYGVETMKSLILPFNVLSFNLTVADAVTAGLLEQKVQSRTWGSVEFHHGVEEEELNSRLAAASLFVYLTSNHTTKLQQ